MELPQNQKLPVAGQLPHQVTDLLFDLDNQKSSVIMNLTRR